MKPRIGITQGDISGIGYELLLKVLQDTEMLELCTPIVFGSSKVADFTAHHLNLNPLLFHPIKQCNEAQDGRINLFDISVEEYTSDVFGHPTEATLQAEAASLNAAVAASNHQTLQALLILPGQLNNMENSHSLTDYFAQAIGSQRTPQAWWVNGDTRCCLLQIASADDFTAAVHHAVCTLREDCGFLRPRLAVVAPDNTYREAIVALQNADVFVFGPFSVEQFAREDLATHYDGLLFADETNDTMRLFLDNASTHHVVGVVSGLNYPIAYTPQHVSYEIAGKGEADEAPLRDAFYKLIDCVRLRKNYKKASAHPLEKSWIPKGRDDVKLDLTKEE